MNLAKKLPVFFCLIIILQVSTNPVFADTETPTPTQTPAIINNDLQDEILKTLDEYLNNSSNAEALQIIELQSTIFEATISRIEFYLNILVVSLTILSILLAIFGFGFSKYFIGKKVEEQIEKNISQKIESSVDNKLGTTLNEWDQKFEKLYKEAKSIINQEGE